MKLRDKLQPRKGKCSSPELELSMLIMTSGASPATTITIMSLSPACLSLLTLDTSCCIGSVH